MRQEYAAGSFRETKKIGKKFAREIINPVRDTEGKKERQRKQTSNRVRKLPPKRAFVVALEGELGGGKTTFLQGFAKGLGIKEKILSPTFVILKRFKISRLIRVSSAAGENLKFKNFYHLDCYRIRKAEEILDLGFKKIVSDPGNIVAIEWANKIKKIIPKNALWLKFEFVDKNKRKIKRISR